MDCRRKQRRSYESAQLAAGRSQFKAFLSDQSEVVSVQCVENALIRNSDAEPLDKYYVVLKNRQHQETVYNKAFQLLPIYNSSVTADTLELLVPHSGYVYAQDTLSNRLKLKRRSLIELIICFCIILFIIKTFIL